MTNVLRTFWSDWFIYFREGSAAVAGGVVIEKEEEEEKGWKTVKSRPRMLRDLTHISS